MRQEASIYQLRIIYTFTPVKVIFRLAQRRDTTQGIIQYQIGQRDLIEQVYSLLSGILEVQIQNDLFWRPVNHSEERYGTSNGIASCGKNGRCITGGRQWYHIDVVSGKLMNLAPLRRA